MPGLDSDPSLLVPPSVFQTKLCSTTHGHGIKQGINIYFMALLIFIALPYTFSNEN